MKGRYTQLSHTNNLSSEKKCIKSIDIHTKEFILTPSKRNTTSNKKQLKLRNCYYNSANKIIKQNKDLFSLYSKKNNYIKKYIKDKRNLVLLENKIKKLDEESRKILSKINNSKNNLKLKEERKNNYQKKKSFLSDLLNNRKKELEEKKNKVKMMRNQESNSNKNIIIYKKVHSENLSERKRLLKKKILQDLSEEKNKIKEERKRKMDLIKNVDKDILERKESAEKRKKLIEKKQLEQEIKIQSNFNKKLAMKIYEYQKIGLDKIDFLQKIKLKLENKF